MWMTLKEIWQYRYTPCEKCFRDASTMENSLESVCWIPQGQFWIKLTFQSFFFFVLINTVSLARPFEDSSYIINFFFFIFIIYDVSSSLLWSYSLIFTLSKGILRNFLTKTVIAKGNQINNLSSNLGWDFVFLWERYESNCSLSPYR